MRGRILIGLVVLSCLAGFTWAAPAEETPLLAHQPTLSRTQVVFVYGGDLWSGARGGGEGRQLTKGGGEGVSVLSADGEWGAVTGGYDGDGGVVVVSAGGGGAPGVDFDPP